MAMLADPQVNGDRPHCQVTAQGPSAHRPERTMDTLVCAHRLTQEDTDILKDKVSPLSEDTYSGAVAAPLGPPNAARGAQHGTPWQLTENTVGSRHLTVRYLAWLTLNSPPLCSKAHFRSNILKMTRKKQRVKTIRVCGTAQQQSPPVQSMYKGLGIIPHCSKTKLTFIKLWFNHAKCDESKVYDQITPSKIIKVYYVTKK